MSEGPEFKLSWNDRRRRSRIRWWHILIALANLAFLNELYVGYILSRHQQGLAPEAPPIPENHRLN
jgi:hypothetical protein